MTFVEYAAAHQRMAEAARAALPVMERWASVMHAETMLQILEPSLKTWTPAHQYEFRVLVRRLHKAEPDEGLAVCMLRVGAAMEAGYGGGL